MQQNHEDSSRIRRILRAIGRALHLVPWPVIILLVKVVWASLVRVLHHHGDVM